MGRAIHLAHAAPAEELAEPVAAHLPRPGHLLAQPGDDVRDHDRGAEHEKVGVVHEQGVVQRAESESPVRPAISMPTVSIEAASKPATSIFQGGAGTIAAVMRMIGPIQVIIGVATSGLGVRPGPVDQDAQREGHRHHVDEREVGHERRSAVAGPEVGVQRQREHDARGGDGVEAPGSRRRAPAPRARAFRPPAAGAVEWSRAPRR